MANVQVRKDIEAKPVTATPVREVSPARLMRSLLGWDPFRTWDPFREMAPFLEQTAAVAFSPTFDVKETKESYEFRADVPGVLEKDLEVSLTGNRLTVTGKREAEREDKQDTYYAYERSFGSFTRSFTLPVGTDIEKLRADLKDGVLSISLPKKPEQQTKKIPVSTEAKKS